MVLGLILIGIVVVLTIVLGLLNYRIGKRGKPRQYGVIIPVAYFAIRVAMTAMAHGKNGSVTSSVTGALVVAAIYYVLYLYGTRNQVKK